MLCRSVAVAPAAWPVGLQAGRHAEDVCVAAVAVGGATTRRQGRRLPRSATTSADGASDNARLVRLFGTAIVTHSCALVPLSPCLCLVRERPGVSRWRVGVSSAATAHAVRHLSEANQRYSIPSIQSSTTFRRDVRTAGPFLVPLGRLEGAGMRAATRSLALCALRCGGRPPKMTSPYDVIKIDEWYDL